MIKEWKEGKYTIRETEFIKHWYFNEKLHRENGPAVEYGDGDSEWWFNGNYHRENGPAIDYLNQKEWYLHGESYKENEHKQELRKLKLEAIGL